MSDRSRLLGGARIWPDPLRGGETLADLVDNAFLAYNGGRLREACQLLTRKILGEDVLVGLSLTGALTPAGLGRSCLIPLVRAGFVDWIVSTGANLYHDTHFGIGLAMHRGSPFLDDTLLRREGVVRIYDILFEYEVLLSTDAFFREIVCQPEFQSEMGTAEFHWQVGKYVAAREQALGLEDASLLACCHRYGVPVYTSSPGDSSIGMNVAALELAGNGCRINPSIDVNETAALVLDRKRAGGRSALVILGGGSPKNFVLQTEPQIQEVLGIAEAGHDYYLQCTDARQDTGGLSGATPAEAVSWGKVDPDRLPDAVVVYTDTTIALPILTAYALTRTAPREPRRLYHRRAEVLDDLTRAYAEARAEASQAPASHATASQAPTLWAGRDHPGGPSGDESGGGAAIGRATAVTEEGAPLEAD
ncbi:MAG: deoxyhypusine synthase [Gemmatimonadetes bacterium]|nr:deoxyhypusine synthase [Gemmatimonadota bacterium]